MSSSDSDIELTPDVIRKEAEVVVGNLLPPVSKERYLKSYNEFIKWRAEKKVKSLSESVFLAYFSELSKKYQPSTLWSVYSMLKATVQTKHDVNLKNYTKLTAFLKRTSDGFKSKKSKVFTAQEVETFLNQAPDENYLAIKVALIFGISGACRGVELANITTENVERHGQLVLVKLLNTKTKIDRTFVVREEFTPKVMKYQGQRPNNIETNRFFLKYQQGKCLRQVIGKNTIASMPKLIATYLNLPNTDHYSGHCFRRTSATLLADAGGDLSMLKRHGGWKSSKTAEGYVEDSVQNKAKISSKITEAIHLHCEDNSPRPGTSKDSAYHHPDLGTEDNISVDDLPVSCSANEIMTSPTFTEPILQDAQLSQKISNVNIPGKNLSLTFTNCSNFTINFK